MSHFLPTLGEVILDGSVQEFEGMSFYLTVIATDRSDGGCGIRPPNMVAVNISVSLLLFAPSGPCTTQYRAVYIDTPLIRQSMGLGKMSD